MAKRFCRRLLPPPLNQSCGLLETLAQAQPSRALIKTALLQESLPEVKPLWLIERGAIEGSGQLLRRQRAARSGAAGGQPLDHLPQADELERRRPGLMLLIEAERPLRFGDARRGRALPRRVGGGRCRERLPIL